MSYGLQISAAGVMTSMYRMDVHSNNLANMGTVGFKADVPVAMSRRAAREEDGLMHLPGNEMLERLGAGTLLFPNRIEFSQGALRTTGNPLDVAIEGDGFFLVRKLANENEDSLRLTRDGRFTMAADGTLQTAAEGLPVLDAQNRPIVLASDAQVSISADGTLMQDGQPVARLAVVTVSDAGNLRKEGNGLFAADSQTLKTLRAAPGRVVQGHTEDSSVDPVEALMRVISSGRDMDANIAMAAQHDRMMERAIASLGRIA